jgi:hypothetical protein
MLMPADAHIVLLKLNKENGFLIINCRNKTRYAKLINCMPCFSLNSILYLIYNILGCEIMSNKEIIEASLT